MLFSGANPSPGSAGYGIQYLPTGASSALNAPGGALPWQHSAAAAAAGSQIPGLALPPAAAAYAAALQNLQVSQLNQQHLAQAQVIEPAKINFLWLLDLGWLVFCQTFCLDIYIEKSLI